MPSGNGPAWVAHPLKDRPGGRAAFIAEIPPTEKGFNPAVDSREVRRFEIFLPDLLADLVGLIKAHDISHLILSAGERPSVPVSTVSDTHNISRFMSGLSAELLEYSLKGLFREKIEGRAAVCGVLVNYLRRGVLLIGKSGSGKSSCARELLRRGGRLVSDDVVDVRTDANGRIMGESPKRTRDLMEVKGLGIVNIRACMGAWAVKSRSPVNFVVGMHREVCDEKVGRMEILGRVFRVSHIPAALSSAEAADRIENIVLRHRCLPERS